MSGVVEKLIARLKDDRGLGDRWLLADECANELARLLKENRYLKRELGHALSRASAAGETEGK